MTFATDFAQALQQKFDAEHKAKQIEDAKNDRFVSDLHYVFTVEAGQKFDRIVQVLAGSTNPQRSVHAFVEKSTGKLIKAASWKTPAKRSNGELQSQFNLSTPSGFAEAVAAADKHGGYLYLR